MYFLDSVEDTLLSVISEDYSPEEVIDSLTLEECLLLAISAREYSEGLNEEALVQIDLELGYYAVYSAYDKLEEYAEKDLRENLTIAYKNKIEELLSNLDVVEEPLTEEDLYDYGSYVQIFPNVYVHRYGGEVYE